MLVGIENILKNYQTLEDNGIVLIEIALEQRCKWMKLNVQCSNYSCRRVGGKPANDSCKPVLKMVSTTHWNINHLFSEHSSKNQQNMVSLEKSCVLYFLPVVLNLCF